MSIIMGGNRTDLIDVLALAEAGKISCHATAYSLDETPDVIDKLEAGEIIGRAVITPYG